MEKRIINFIKLLRDSDIRISIAESIDACEALKHCNIINKQQFKIALRSTLIKQKSDILIFNKIFNLYFREPMNKNQQEELTDQDFSNMMKQLQDQFNNNNFNELGKQKSLSNKSKPSEINKDVNQYNQEKKNKDLYKMGSESELKNIAKQMANSRNYEDWEKENIKSTCNRLMIQHNMEYTKVLAKNETNLKQHNNIEEKYDRLKQYLKEEIEKSMVKQFGNSIISEIIKNNDIMEKDLSNLAIDELEQVQKIIKKIAKKISTHVSRKEKRAKKGKIDIKKTIKTSIKYNNTPGELKFINKKKTKPELVVLCDISGSVWYYVSFMLQLVIGIQNAFNKVESYVFIDHIKNITEEILNSDDLRKTLNNFLHDKSLGYGTDYGNVFKEFYEEKIFNKKTVVIILGDAENTGKTIGDNYLKLITDQCKVIYWLNPNEIENWYNNYSKLKKYEIHCKNVFEYSTLRHLENFIRKLITL
ncbi:MAG: VWA domain-containing protein [archaeon]